MVSNVVNFTGRSGLRLGTPTASSALGSNLRLLTRALQLLMHELNDYSEQTNRTIAETGISDRDKRDLWLCQIHTLTRIRKVEQILGPLLPLIAEVDAPNLESCNSRIDEEPAGKS